MKNNPFLITIVVILAVGLGVILTYQQTSSPLMRQFVMQQKEILESQKRIEERLNSGANALSVDMLGRKVDSIAQALRNTQPSRPTVPQPPSEEYTKVYDIPIGNSPIRGQENAPVTIVEFMDFQCPFCAKFHPVLNKVLEEYPDKVRYVIKNFPLSFHQQAAPAAKAALAAGEQGKYWEMAEGLLANFQNLSDEKFDEIAQEIGLDMEKFHKDLEQNDARYEEIIRNDVELAGKVEVRGTPTYYINGRKTRARTLEAYKAEIEAILNK